VGFNWDGVTEERLFDKTSFAKKINPVFDYDFFVSFDDDMEDIRVLLKSYINANDLYRCR
jgi:hypothetical protein